MGSAVGARGVVGCPWFLMRGSSFMCILGFFRQHSTFSFVGFRLQKAAERTETALERMQASITTLQSNGTQLQAGIDTNADGIAKANNFIAGVQDHTEENLKLIKQLQQTVKRLNVTVHAAPALRSCRELKESGETVDGTYTVPLPSRTCGCPCVTACNRAQSHSGRATLRSASVHAVCACRSCRMVSTRCRYGVTCRAATHSSAWFTRRLVRTRT